MVVLICISLMTHDVAHIFMFIGHSYIIFYEVLAQVFCPFLNY